LTCFATNQFLQIISNICYLVFKDPALLLRRRCDRRKRISNLQFSVNVILAAFFFFLAALATRSFSVSIKRTVVIPINHKAVKKLLNYFHVSSIRYGTRSINPVAQEGNNTIPKQILLYFYNKKALSQIRQGFSK